METLRKRFWCLEWFRTSKGKGYHCFSTDWISFSLLFSHFLFSLFFLYRMFKINCKRYMMVIYLILCSKKVQESSYIRLKNQANQPGAKQLYQEQRTVHKSFPNPSHTPPFPKTKKNLLKIPCFSPLRSMIAREQPQSRSGNEPKRAYHRWRWKKKKRNEEKGGEKKKGEEEFNGRVYARSWPSIIGQGKGRGDSLSW